MIIHFHTTNATRKTSEFATGNGNHTDLILNLLISFRIGSLELVTASDLASKAVSPVKSDRSLSPGSALSPRSRLGLTISNKECFNGYDDEEQFGAIPKSRTSNCREETTTENRPIGSPNVNEKFSANEVYLC